MFTRYEYRVLTYCQMFKSANRYGYEQDSDHHKCGDHNDAYNHDDYQDDNNDDEIF